MTICSYAIPLEPTFELRLTCICSTYSLKHSYLRRALPYRIAFLSKYPPLEGGIAAKTYWLARGLAARGHEIHVITDGIQAGREYRIPGGDTEPATTPKLWVHR